MISESKLPSYTLYRINCHVGKGNTLAYLSSTTELRVIQFDDSYSIKTSIVIQIPQEPMKNVELAKTDHSDPSSKQMIVAAFLSQFIIYNPDGTVFHIQKIPLSQNIVYCKNTYLCVKEYTPNKLVAARVYGELSIFSLNEKGNGKTICCSTSQTIHTSLAVMNQICYIGTQHGKIHAKKLSSGEQLGIHESGSKFPILNIIANPSNKQIIATTCEGEIMMMSATMDKLSVISAHYSSYGDRLYTYGEDCIMHVFQVQGERNLKVIKTQYYKKLPSLLFSIHKKNFLTFYEDPTMIQV